MKFVGFVDVHLKFICLMNFRALGLTHKQSELVRRSERGRDNSKQQLPSKKQLKNANYTKHYLLMFLVLGFSMWVKYVLE